MCKRNVQTGCTGYILYIAAIRMVENNDYEYLTDYYMESYWCYEMLCYVISVFDVKMIKLINICAYNKLSNHW